MKSMLDLLVETFPVSENELWEYKSRKKYFTHTFPTVNAFARGIFRFLNDASDPSYPHQLEILNSFARKMNRDQIGDLLWGLWSCPHAQKSLWDSICYGYSGDCDELYKIFGKTRIEVLDYLESDPNKNHPSNH